VEERLAEGRRLSQLLVDVADRAKADFAEAVAPFGLPVHLARALLLLTDPMPMRDLACQLRCDRSYITALADKLADRGLLERVPGEDRRIKLLALTDAGEALRDEISAAAAEQSMVLHRLTDDQRATLTPLLETLIGDDRSTCPATSTC
jgi:DNA-binding MarR family transcriptional regulator